MKEARITETQDAENQKTLILLIDEFLAEADSNLGDNIKGEIESEKVFNLAFLRCSRRAAFCYRQFFTSLTKIEVVSGITDPVTQTILPLRNF